MERLITYKVWDEKKEHYKYRAIIIEEPNIIDACYTFNQKISADYIVSIVNCSIL
jgi:hypothetical protein